VHLFFNWHSGTHTSMATIGHGDRRTYYTYSDDDGLTWASSRNLTANLLPPSFTWDAVGPGAGIQKLVPPNVGRLIVPATKRNFHSDDHGATWAYTMMPTTGSANLTGESTVAECLDGSLLRNDRATGSYWSTAKRRWVSRGQIGNFPTPVPQDNLLDPRSHASMLRYNLPSPGRLIFLNSDSTVNRLRMKVRISYDDGKTWPVAKQLHAGLSAYSDLAVLTDGSLACLHEVNGYKAIQFSRFSLDWLTDSE
jgi:sialidase-1